MSGQIMPNDVFEVVSEKLLFYVVPSREIDAGAPDDWLWCWLSLASTDDAFHVLSAEYIEQKVEDGTFRPRGNLCSVLRSISNELMSRKDVQLGWLLP